MWRAVQFNSRLRRKAQPTAGTPLLSLPKEQEMNVVGLGEHGNTNRSSGQRWTTKEIEISLKASKCQRVIIWLFGRCSGAPHVRTRTCACQLHAGITSSKGDMMLLTPPFLLFDSPLPTPLCLTPLSFSLTPSHFLQPPGNCKSRLNCKTENRPSRIGELILA